MNRGLCSRHPVRFGRSIGWPHKVVPAVEAGALRVPRMVWGAPRRLPCDGPCAPCARGRPGALHWPRRAPRARLSPPMISMGRVCCPSLVGDTTKGGPGSGSGSAVGVSQGHSRQRDRAGILRVEMTDAQRPGYIESLKPRVLLCRWGDPAELAAPLVWLASDGGGFVTGRT